LTAYWQEVARFSGPSATQFGFDQVDTLLTEEGDPSSSRLLGSEGERALVAGWATLGSYVQVASPGAKPERTDIVVLVSGVENRDDAERLIRTVEDIQGSRPRWLAAFETEPRSNGLADYLESAASHTLILRMPSGGTAELTLHAVPPNHPATDSRLTPIPGRKIGEGPDNLKERESWFRGRYRENC
jgi:hypothetical protein